MRLYSSVDDDPIAIKQSCVFHAVTLYVTIERCFGMPDVVPVKIKCLMPVIVSRRRKTCRYTSMFKFKFGVEYALSYLNISHITPFLISVSQI